MRPQAILAQAFHSATCHVQRSERGPAGETAVDRFLDTGVGVKVSADKFFFRPHAKGC